MTADIALNVDTLSGALAAGLALLAIVAYRRTSPPLPPGRRALLRLLRTASFVLLALLAANPVLVSTRTEKRSPLIPILLDRSRSMSVRDVDGRSRIAAAVEDARRLEREIEAAGADVVIIPFAGAAAEAPLLPDSAVAADGDGTDIRGALETVRDRYRGASLTGAVLLTDGRITRGMVSGGGAGFVPVFAVGYGDTAVGANVALEDVVAERVAFRGSALPVEAVVRATGFRGSALEVRLLEDGKPLESITLGVRRDDELLSAALTYTPEREGSHRLTVEAAAGRAERHRDDNSETIRIEVRKERVRLLYIDQLADWNAAFLGDLVGRSERLEADIALWKSGSGFVSGPNGTPWNFPQTDGELSRYDLVIFSDDARLLAARENVEALTRYVERGGSVLFLADESSPLARSASVQLLEAVLPLRRSGAARAEYGERFVKVSPYAAGDPLATMLGPGEPLAAMPPLPGHIAGLSATAGARVPFVLEGRDGSSPFLAIDRRGEGLAAAVLGFPLWRWKLAGEEGGRVYESFFGGVVQYLAEGAKSPAVALDAERSVYRSGDRIRLTASIGDRSAPEAIRGEIRRSGDGGGAVAATLLFEPDARRRGVYRAIVNGLLPGEYRAHAAEVRSGAEGASGSADFSVEPLSVEFLDTSRDGAFLQRLARETGGGVIERPALASIAPHLDTAVRSAERRSFREFRGSLFAFAGVVALLGAEWMTRKAWGLV